MALAYHVPEGYELLILRIQSVSGLKVGWLAPCGLRVLFGDSVVEREAWQNFSSWEGEMVFCYSKAKSEDDNRELTVIYNGETVALPLTTRDEDDLIHFEVIGVQSKSLMAQIASIPMPKSDIMRDVSVRALNYSGKRRGHLTLSINYIPLRNPPTGILATQALATSPSYSQPLQVPHLHPMITRARSHNMEDSILARQARHYGKAPKPRTSKSRTVRRLMTVVKLKSRKS